jgi:hypothetical protein
MKINILFSSAVLALGLGSVAHAVTFTYNFTITGGNVSSIGPISGGSGSPTVTVTPYSWTGSELYSNSTNNSNTTGVHITQNASAGLGVLNSSDDGSSNVDNSG